MNNKSGVLLAFLVGVAVGVNWPKIRKHLGPYMETAGEASAKGFHGLLGLFVSGKERVEDLFAEAQVKKTKKAKRMIKPRKKAMAKRPTKVTAYPLLAEAQVKKTKEAKKMIKPRKKAMAKRSTKATAYPLIAEAQVKKTKKAKKMTKPRKKATAKRSTKATTYTLSQPKHEVAFVQPFRKFA